MLLPMFVLFMLSVFSLYGASLPIQIAVPEAVPNLVCYYSVDDPQLPPEALDAYLCSHLVTGFTTVANCSIVDSEERRRKYVRVLRLREQNPLLKVLLMTGSKGGAGMAEVVSSAENRTRFIHNAIGYVVANGFDGLDIDWEFPGTLGDLPGDRNLFVTLLKEFRQATEMQSGEDRLLLTVDVAAALAIIFPAYNVTEMAKYVDYLNIMCYDYHQYVWYYPFTGHNSPLFRRSDDMFLLATLNMAWSANFYVELGVPKEQLHVGVATYGHSYVLFDADTRGIGAPATGPGISGGWITSSDACRFSSRSEATVTFDMEAFVPYASAGTDWISFDNVHSMSAKASWIAANQFAGVMLFSLNADDWRGDCNATTTFPLTQAVHNAIYNKQASQPSQTIN